MDDRFPVGWEVTENAINIDEWQIYGDSEIQFKLKPDRSENVITFYYRQSTWVTVKYVDASGNMLADDLEFPTYIGEECVFYAKEIEGYTPREESITISVVEAGQVVVFIYDEEQEDLITVTIRYVDKYTNRDIAEPEIDVFPRVVGDIRTYTAKNIENYSFSGTTIRKRIKITADTPSEVEEKFEYVEHN
ncbi:MAG: MucBP domain-containing protein [Bacteroidales bacterium]|nr:MucBP domain-containing protein [Bacteroidales bacterium]